MARKKSVTAASAASRSTVANPSVGRPRAIIGAVIDDQLYTAEETADIFRCSRKTLERWRLEGHGPKVTRLWEGGRPFYRGKHILEALDSAVEEHVNAGGNDNGR